MPTLTFEGETHGEIVIKVTRWLASLEESAPGNLSAVEAVNQGAELTKDALRIIAAAAPAPVAQSDVVKGLTNMGYKVTDATKDAVVMGLDTIEEATGGSVVRQVTKTGRKVVWEMNSTVARQVLKGLRRWATRSRGPGGPGSQGRPADRPKLSASPVPLCRAGAERG